MTTQERILAFQKLGNKSHKPPSIRTMEKWVCDGVAKATDGCRVEPDGYCPHGKPSWLIQLGVI